MFVDKREREREKARAEQNTITATTFFGEDGGGSKKKKTTGSCGFLLERGGVLALRLGAELKVLASLQNDLANLLALGALKLENELLGNFDLVVLDRLGLATETPLLAVVTSLS